MANLSADVKMFPSLELVAPTDTPPSTSSTLASRKSRRTMKPKLPGKPKGSVESRQLPGLLSTVKPTIHHGTNSNGVSVLVGFNAAGMQFDGEDPTYSDTIKVKAQKTVTSNEATLTNTDLNEGAGTVEKLQEGKKLSGDIVVDELRNYTMMMDKFSLHNFVIYGGSTLKNTPEFQSFRRQYTHEWGSISYVIDVLEGIMQDHLVKLAIINGPALYRLAALNKPTVTKDEVLECVSNIEQILPNLRGNLTGDDNEVSFWAQFRAIVKMQSLVRQFISARRVRRLRLQLMGCIRIQAHLRKVVYRKFGLDRLRNDKQELDTRFRTNQNKLLSMFEKLETQLAEKAARPSRTAFNVAQLKADLRNKKNDGERRLIIHVPSITAEEYLRLDMEGLAAIQNAHISCLHQLADPDVHIIYVTPIAVNAEIQAYYDRFLSILGINTLPKRLHFIHPELIKRLPQHLPLAQVLWCSAAAMRKIRNHIKYFKNVVIVPGSVTWIERRIANMLDVPLLSCEPVVVETLMNRSYIKKMFMGASVNIPVGAHDILSRDDLFIALSRLISSNLDVNRWVIKLNLDFNNEGTLILESHKLEIIGLLRGEQAELFEQNGGLTGAWFSRPVQASVRKRILINLREKFESVVRITRKDIYPTIKDFMERLHRIGAVVEAEPIEKLGRVDGLCFISPTGKIDFYSGMDVTIDDKLQVQSFMAPQSLIPTKALEGATEAMAQYLFEKWKVIGYLTVRFQAFWDALDDIPRLWGISVLCGHTPQFGALGTTALAINKETSGINNSIPLPSLNFTVDDPDLKHLANGKHCMYVPWTSHEPLAGTRDDVFFKFCGMRGISFDNIEKTGILFFLSDSLLGGRLSFVSIANSRFRALEQAINAITFITQQFGKGGSNNNYDQLSSLLVSLKKLFKQEEKLAGPLAVL